LSSESFGAFLDTIGQIPVLTRQEEVELAKRIAAGDLGAKETLIRHNIRLAVSIARRYSSNSNSSTNISLEDLVQEGILGVNRAAEKFDHTKGFKFSTYATHWIMHFIQRAINRDRSTIRVPGHIVARKRAIERYLRENPEANIADAAVELGITLETAEETLAGGAHVVASLDQAFAGEGHGDRHSTVADDSAPDPAELITDAHPELTDALSALTPLEQRVVKLRWGFNGPVRSRDQVAQELDIRPHVVQRTQKEALKKLHTALADTHLMPEAV
jgi:RNA polymerase primary sigma factor